MRKLKLGNIFIHLCLIIFCLTCLIPMILALSVSLTDNKAVITSGYTLIPKKFSLEAYRIIFLSPENLLTGYKNSIIITAIGTVLNLFVTALVAYPLSRKNFRFRGSISFFIFFTMLFSGGLVPFYILIVKYLGWKNMLISIIVPGIAAPFNIFLLRIFFQDIPDSLIEAAKIDGSSDYNTFFKIVLPLSKASLATLALMIVLGYWNDAFNPMLFLDSPDKYPLQLILNNITSYINEIKTGLFQGSGIQFDTSSIPSDSIMFGLMIISTAPMMFLFSFLQKYFVKGVTIGAVKG